MKDRKAAQSPGDMKKISNDDLVKSLKMPFSVIPAKAGIQYFQRLINTLDSGFHRSDDDFVKSSPATARLGAQKLRSEAQSRFERDRWTFYEIISNDLIS
jgi:hypothetical protein